jgi:hypothetical protein
MERTEIAVILFVVALGGFGLLSFRLRGKPLYTPLSLVHAFGAIMGFVCLMLERITNGCSDISSGKPLRKPITVGTRECTLH